MKKKEANGRMFYWSYINWLNDSDIRFNEQGKQSKARRYTKDLLLMVKISNEAEISLADVYQTTCIG